MNYEEVTLDDAQEWLGTGGLPDGWNWYEALRLKPVRGSDLHEAMKLLAYSWTTCACGSLCDAIPRGDCGTPEDDKLFGLGCDFTNAVAATDWDLATKILDQIEARSGELLAEMQYTNNTNDK